ncbi:amino acid permease [Intestinibaculum porci]|uniref:Amino acid permease n=1 Tax=Intestinibaculum porci TaxID=2487118 RepID=A0A3G9J3J5_9FIRM|nr:amino acid permease [Intestinibaculum porci]MDD6349440.1 amino acid permease [Intestinibaculum porci]MDD6422827.1 amino acid permease [Intestinibaculum porci]BBH25720.1 amino acid permease [Intestinibaculum porci]
MDQSKRIKWSTLAFMAFSTVWGFGNVLNGFIYFNGIQVIFSWILMFALYFVPYALMVGELGSAFKEAGGGVSSWIHETMGPKMAYYAGFTYWACHITYIASKGSGGLKALSWVIFRNAETFASFKPWAIQLATLGVFLLFCYIASRGLTPLKALTSIAGTSMFVMSLLYIVMMFAAPAINPGAHFASLDFSLKNLVPQFNVKYFTSLSILVFAVGGCEKISPYVNKLEKPEKEFPRSMITLAIMVAVCAILGTIAMGLMFDPKDIMKNFDAYNANGSYWAFQKLGQYYHMGDLLMIIYAICNAIGQFSTLILSIDAPLRMLLDNEDARQFIPKKLLKQNKYGAYVNGIWLVVILSGAIILVQGFVPNADVILTQLTKLNSVAMTLRYLWVFLAYIALRNATNYAKFKPEYRAFKSQAVAKFFGIWCFVVTAACDIMGMYDTDTFTMVLKIITPLILFALGLIMPAIAKHEQA